MALGPSVSYAALNLTISYVGLEATYVYVDLQGTEIRIDSSGLNMFIRFGEEVTLTETLSIDLNFGKNFLDSLAISDSILVTMALEPYSGANGGAINTFVING